MTEVNISKLNRDPIEPMAQALKKSVFAPLKQFFRFPGILAGGEFAKLLWLVRLRWLAVGLFFALAGPALIMGYLSRETVPRYLGMVGVLLIFNLFTHLSLSEKERAISPFWICFQMAFDLCSLTTILAITEGFANPFIALFLLNVALGGLLIQGRLSWPFLLLAHTFLGFLQFQFAIRNVAFFDGRFFGTLIAYHLLILSFWFVMRSLGAHLERQFAREARAKIVMEKQDRLRAIGALAAGFSHEFASPLNSAKIRLERAQRSNPSEDVIEALESVKACEAVVHQMNSSQMDNRNLVFKEIVVAELLQDIIDSWKEDHAETAVELQIEDNSSGQIPPVNFAQVVLNLLDNAVEAAPAKTIEVILRGLEDRFELLFKDEGPGFPSSVLARFGEPFVTTKTDGTGLGLYVSQLFCQSIGGTLSIGNREDGPGAFVQLEWPKRTECS